MEITFKEEMDNRSFNEQNAFIRGQAEGIEIGFMRATSSILETMNNKYFQLGPSGAFHWMKEHMEAYINSRKKV